MFARCPARGALCRTALIMGLLATAQGNSTPLRIVTVADPPFVTYDAAKSGNAAFGGAVIELLEYIFNRARLVDGIDFEPAYYLSPDGTYGVQAANGTWGGAVGEVVYGRANMTGCLLTVTTQRLQAVSFGIPFASTGNSVLVRTTEKEASMWTWLKPFSTQLWFVILAIVLASAIVIWLIDWASPYGSWSRRHELEEKREFLLPNTLMGAIMTLLEKEWESPFTVSSRIVVTGFFFLIMFTHAAYEAGLNGIEVSESLQQGIRDYTDIAREQLPFGVIANSAVSSFFRENPSFQIRRMATYMRGYPTLADAALALRERQIQAVIGSTQMLQYQAEQAPCDLSIVGLPMNVAFWALALPFAGASAALKEAVNEGILAALEDGTLGELLQGAIESAGGACDIEVAASGEVGGEGVKPAPIQQFGGIFIMFGVLVALGWTMLGLEWVIFRQHKSPYRVVRRVNEWLGHEYEDGHEPGDHEDNMTDAKEDRAGRVHAMVGTAVPAAKLDGEVGSPLVINPLREARADTAPSSEGLKLHAV